MGAKLGMSIEGLNGLGKALAQIKKLGGNARPPLKRFGERMKGWTADSIRNRRDPATGASHKPLSPLSEHLKASGARKTRYRLLNSIVSRPAKVTGTSVTIGSNMVYANVQQEGGTIRPKNSKHLAIPLTRKADRAGSARRFWQQNKSKRPFIKTSKAGNKVIVLKGRSGGLEAHFLLLKKVTVPARPYMGFPPDAEDMLVRDFEAYARVLVNAAKRDG